MIVTSTVKNKNVSIKIQTTLRIMNNNNKKFKSLQKIIFFY